MKHTQGEWKVNTNWALSVECGEKTISSLRGIKHTKEDIANAKLIAAAPELLESLIQCETILTHLFSTMRGHHHAKLATNSCNTQEQYNIMANQFSEENKENYRILENVKQAIKKATE